MRECVRAVFSDVSPYRVNIFFREFPHPSKFSFTHGLELSQKAYVTGAGGWRSFVQTLAVPTHWIVAART